MPARGISYDLINRIIYLSVPRDLDPEDLARLEAACGGAESIEYATGYQAIDWLGPDHRRDADTSRVVIRFEAKNMVIDSNRIITRKLKDHTISISLAELAKSFRHTYAFNGPALALAPGPGNTSYVLANHSAPISFRGDPVLIRLCEQLLDPSMTTRRDTAQALLDFVTKAIRYTHHGDLEIFMRPVDVLLAGEADCSGKVILYGSLLEQVNIPYLLVYLDGHITVGVEGHFPKSNNMFFEHNGRSYTLAETTAESFVIGKSDLVEPMKTWDFRYLQRPGTMSKLFDVWRSDSLEFAEMVDLEGYRAPAVR